MSLDLQTLFRPDVSALELVVRTSLIYLGLLGALRLMARRSMGALELPELLMVVLIADGVQNGMAGEYHSLTGALIVAGTMLGWNYALDALAYRTARLRKLLCPGALKVVENGRLLHHNMRRELVTEDELRSRLRTESVEDLREVKLAYLEPNGELSVIKQDQQPEPTRGRHRAARAG